MPRPARREALFWIEREKPTGERTAFIQPAADALFSLLRSAIAGHAGKLHQIFSIDQATARDVPADLVGRELSRRQAERLVAHLVRAAKKKKAATPRGAAAKSGRKRQRRYATQPYNPGSRPRGR